ncbi:MAG: 3-deoxy-D-manno-octulosonic acid kinase [Halieaceae bacterium]|jgi:3-deoxy-D-manno-octulosonic acid kinase|nr:3-deoxy-D-manno-octulosonic acid kinase [Halieaceae bacterium]
MREKTITVEGRTVIFDADGINATAPAALFDTSQYDSVRRVRLGRGNVRFIDHGGCQWVMREYLRGGVISKVVRASYLYLGRDSTRMAREFRFLAYLRKVGLPVPRPVAAQIVQKGLTYRGALITECLPGSKTLAELLQSSALGADQWRRIGECIRAFHNRGVYHPDLNANNVMLDDDRVYLIDFDRGELRDPEKSCWQLANLERLRRSLQKIQRSAPVFHFEERDWQYLADGYEAACARETEAVAAAAGRPDD